MTLVPSSSRGSSSTGTVTSVSSADTSIVVTNGTTTPSLKVASLTTIAANEGAPGFTELVYRYTVAGATKTSIDTGADTAQAGTNDWTNGDLLEIFITAQTDKAAEADSITLTFNNDGTSIYDRQNVRGVNTTASATNNSATAGFNSLNCHANGGTTGYPTSYFLTVPDFGGTTFFKTGMLKGCNIDGTAANAESDVFAVGYRSTSALTRFAVTALAGQKLAIGSQLLIYKRLSS